MDPSRRQFLVLTGTSALALAGCAEDPPPAAPADAADAAPIDATAVDAAPDAGAPENVAADAGVKDAGAEADSGAEPDAGVRGDAGGAIGAYRYPEDAARFPYGVMAGDMVDDRAVLWTFCPSATSLSLEVYSLDAGPGAPPVVTRDVAATDGGFFHADVASLGRGAWYGYAFVAAGSSGSPVRSAVGRFRAALADDALVPVTMGASSCSHQRARPFPTLLHAGARRDLDFFAHLGDMVYCDGARTAADYRAKYAENLTSTGLRAVLGSTGLYTTWDDHEVDNNFNPETHDATQLAAARAAFFDHRPLRRDPAARDRIYRSARWGRTLEVFTLDCRGERRPSTRNRPEAQYLSRAQMDWLKAGLRASTAVFKVILNSVPVSDFPFPFLSEADRWEGYRDQRAELLGFLVNEGVRDVWWVSGDFHMASVGRLATSGPYAAIREVLVGPAGNTPNVLAGTLAAPQFDFATSVSNYGTLRFDPSDRSVTVSLVDGGGRTLFSRRYAG